MSKNTDNYSTIKIKLTDIMLDVDNSYEKLNEAISISHQLVIHVYQFLRLFILFKYENSQELPYINTNFLLSCFIVLSKKSKSNQKKETSINHLEELRDFYTEIYQHLGYQELLDKKNLAQILTFASKEIITSIENNIKLHFYFHLRRYVRCSFKRENNESLSLCKTNREKKEMTKRFNKELSIVTKELMDGCLKCSLYEYEDWYDKIRDLVLPIEYRRDHLIHLKNDPQHYLKNMIFMNRELEKEGYKMYQFFPLRTNIIPKYITLDTTSLLYLFFEDKKLQSQYQKKIDENKVTIWETFFKLDKKVFKDTPKYTFDYTISTNGYSASIRKIEKTSKIGKDIKKKRMQEGANKAKRENKLNKVSAEDRDQAKQKKEIEKRQKNIDTAIKIKQEKKEKKEPIVRKQEFPYIEDQTDEEKKKLKESDLVYDDPGKIDLHMFKGKNGKILRYSNKQRLFETKRFKYRRLLENYKKKKKISNIEKQLSTYNSKTCFYTRCKAYIKKKNEVNKLLYKEYENQIFRRYKWYAYINKQKSDSKLVNTIKKTYGKKAVIIMGDWSQRSQMKHFISTPNLGLKRMLSKHFKVYNIDESYTSCINYKTGERNENIYLPDKKKVMRKIHTIFTYQMKNKRMGCINRNKNSIFSIEKIATAILNNEERPVEYRKPKKATNPRSNPQSR